MMKIFSNIYFPGLIFARSARVWLWVLMTAGSVAAQDKPAADWTLSKDARVMRSPLGEPFTRL